MDQVVFGFLGKVAESMVVARVNLNSIMHVHSGLFKSVISGVGSIASPGNPSYVSYVNINLVNNEHTCG